MQPRLIILVVVAAGLAVYFGTRAASSNPPEMDIGPRLLPGDAGGHSIPEVRALQRNIIDYDLPGEEPQIPPEFGIQVEVFPGDTKNRLYYHVSEAHGYYVEYMNLAFYYKPDPFTTRDESPLIVEVPVQNYLTANGTFSSCIEIVPAELDNIGGAIGTSESWGAEMIGYGRARLTNPDVFPPVANVTRCD